MYVWFTIDVIDIADDNGTVVNETKVDFKYSYPSIDFREYYTPIVCKMKNAGAGSAVEGQLTIRSETNSKQLSLTIAKDETTYIVIFTSLRYNGWIEIGYYYRDIANICSYKLVDSIRFFQNENNKTVFEFPNNQKSVQVVNVD